MNETLRVSLAVLTESFKCNLGKFSSKKIYLCVFLCILIGFYSQTYINLLS